jgi:hypothetical protein
MVETALDRIRDMEAGRSKEDCKLLIKAIAAMREVAIEAYINPGPSSLTPMATSWVDRKFDRKMERCEKP